MIISVSSFLILGDVYGLKAAHDTWMFMYFDASLYLPGLYAKLLGFLLFGLSIAYSGGLPRWAGLLLALAPITYLPAEMLPEMIALYLVAVSLILVSLVWMGIYLLMPRAAPPEARQSQPSLSEAS